MWDLIAYHPRGNRDGDYGTPPKLSNMSSPAPWSTLERLATLKKKKILQEYFDKSKPCDLRTELF